MAKSDPRLDGMRTVVVTRADMRVDPAWRREATAVIHYGTHHPDHLLRELRAALASISSRV